MLSEPPAKKIFVSYKYKDSNVLPLGNYTPGEDTNFLFTPRHYVDAIIDTVGEDIIYKGEKSEDDASHLTNDALDSRLKEKIFDSSVTLVLISPNMWERTLPVTKQWIPNEVAYSLRNKTRGDRNSKTNGMLAVALPDARGDYSYAVTKKACGVNSWHTNSFFYILRENMFNRIEKNCTLCPLCLGYHHHGNDHSYILPVRWADFIVDPHKYFERASWLREKQEEFKITKELEKETFPGLGAF